MFNYYTKHKKIINVFFVVLLTFIFALPLLTDELYIGHDCRFHMHRLIGIVEAFQDHQFVPRVYPYTNNGYGYASPLFYCDLFLYPFAIIYRLGIPFTISYKLMIIFYSFLTILITFFVATRICKNNSITPYFIAIAYAFGNYRLYDLYIRSAFGEILAFTFMPLVFYAIYKMFFKKENCYILLGVSFALLVMSHNISFALTCVVFGLFIIYYFISNIDNRELLINITKNIFKAIIIALLLSGWYLFPMLEQMFDQKFWVNYLSEMYDLGKSIIPISGVLNPFAISDNPGIIEIHDIINIGYTLIFIPLLYLFLKKEKKNRYISFLIIVAYFFLFSTCRVIPLYKVGLLRFMQFLFRFYIIIYPLLTIVCGYVIEHIDNYKFKLLLLCVVFVYSIFNVYQINATAKQYNENDFVKDSISRESLYDFSEEIKFRDHNGLEISAGEYLPTTEMVDYLEESTFIKEVREDGYIDIIYDFDRSFTKIDFTYDNPDGKKLIMLPQTYYKGYQAYEVVDGEEKKIETINVPKYKKVGFYVEPGLHTYRCRYEGTVVQNVTLLISLATTIAIGISVVAKCRKNRMK